MSEEPPAPIETAPADKEGEPLRTDILTFVVKAILLLPQLLVPLGFVSFSILDDGLPSEAVYIALLIVAALSLILITAYLNWSRFTYRIGEADIRVESGILSRAARSVPYERIQDVSLEQRLVPRLLGLVEVKFETGAGGKDELSLAYLSEEQGEALRELVRERRDGVTQAPATPATDNAGARPVEPATTLFAMGPKRLFTFGLFEFSLAVFAVIGGLFQYAETFAGFELWDADLWREWVEGSESWISGLGPMVQVISAIAGLITLVVIGSVTGLIRTFLRDWDFRLERTPKGFRRRRGLLTKTDVVMPAHRVQAVRIGTGWLRRRFGWNGLKFISLAQDSGSASHDVAPFAQEEELAPIIHAAGFVPPRDAIDWHRPSEAHRNMSMAFNGAVLGTIGVGLLLLLTFGEVENVDFAGLFSLIPFSIGAILVGREYYLWRTARNAIDGRQVYRRKGWLAPSTSIANRIKLQSVEIKQGPIARWKGYADLHLGLAGGSFALEGVPIARAREMRAAILGSIAEADFSEINR